MKLKWDHYSDQPDIIREKGLKKQIYKQVRWDSFKLLLTNLVFYPVSLLFYFIVPAKKKQPDTHDFFGMSVNLDKSPEKTRALVDELQLNNLLIRMPLHDIENIEKYVEFAEQFSDKNLLINILQDRRHVEDLALAYQSFKQIFKRFSHLSSRFQIANAINRKKWAIFSMGEYLDFYKVAYDLKKEQFPQLTLLGSSVIDFEYYFTVRTLFNFQSIAYDEFSSLLYVDRRGYPENSQMGFDLQKKLWFLHSMLRISPKTTTDIVISETNWPLKNTAPYAPTSETECVSLEDQANYLVRYYLLALVSGVVKNVYWHQLIAPGYGLVDNRTEALRKYPAYYAFKTMITLLSGFNFSHIKQKDDVYHLYFKNDKSHIEVLWALSETTYDAGEKQVLSRDGQRIQFDGVDDKLKLGPSPIYLMLEAQNNEQSNYETQKASL